MDRSIARLNIEHYKRLLGEETDAARRKVLFDLLAEEEAKLAVADATKKSLDKN